jgi:hypothetical protein
LQRVTDGKIISEEEMANYFKKAKVRRLFKIQRLKRNKKGRPTGVKTMSDSRKVTVKVVIYAWGEFTLILHGNSINAYISPRG